MKIILVESQNVNFCTTILLSPFFSKKEDREKKRTAQKVTRSVLTYLVPK